MLPFPPVKGLIFFSQFEASGIEGKGKSSEMLHAANVAGIVLIDYATIIREWGSFIPSGSACCHVSGYRTFNVFIHQTQTSHMPGAGQNAVLQR